jgi:uncharacterized BrkB/YihY/UPF0761 family membrane protein
VLIWVYYSAQLVLMGAEFTSVYAQRMARASMRLLPTIGRHKLRPRI